MTAANKGRRRGVLTAPLTLLIVFLIVIFAIGVLFRVSKIEVSGASIYSNQEIIEASEIEVGDNLFFINKFSAAGNIYSKLPYVSEVSIDRNLPNKITIKVSESKAIARVFDGTDWWSLDKDGKVLDNMGSDETGLIEIIGLTARSPETGTVLDPMEGNTAAVEYLAEILSEANYRSMIAKIQYIDISDPFSPIIGYDNRFALRLLEQGETGYKFDLILSSISQLASGDSGTLEPEVSGGKVHYWPN